MTAILLLDKERYGMLEDPPPLFWTKGRLTGEWQRSTFNSCHLAAPNVWTFSGPWWANRRDG
jgi:hypothetical protein